VDVAAFHTPGRSDSKLKTAPAPTPVQFPSCTPQTAKKRLSSPQADVPLTKFLQTICRPSEIQLAHFEAVGVHVISDACPRDIIPDPAFLPPFEEWLAIFPDDVEEKNEASKKVLNNGKLSPGAKTYIERRQELSIDNTAAFRTVLRLPIPAGEIPVRLGNAYTFFKSLEQLSTYWHDTSLPKNPEESPMDQPSTNTTPQAPSAPQMNERMGPGSPLHAEYRQQLITAFIKMVAYDFGCNVAFARCEPRLHLTPPPPSPPSYFNSSATFIHRTPADPASTRSGIIEGPVAVISSRASTIFSTPADSNLDFGREIVAVLLTAQQRTREGRTEKRFGTDAWWTSKPRWGGGPGGPIGREADTPEELPAPTGPGAERLSAMNEIKRAIGGINGPVTGKRSKRPGGSHLYENYRKMLPPSSGWDRRARYSAIGKVSGSGMDDIFLVSALNHHVSIVRARVPDSLLEALEGKDAEWERVVVWRSRWFDLFLKEDRIQGMDLIWGMMAWLMRSEHPEPEDEDDEENKMDLTA
jgi:hypothetical protein